MNPGGIRADLAENEAGDVTYGNAFAAQPFNNYVTSQTLTGAQIRDLLNEQWNGRNEGAANHKILQVAGLSYTWDRGAGRRGRRRRRRRGHLDRREPRRRHR